MVRLTYKDSQKDIMRKYREDSLKVNLVQKYINKKRIVSDVRLLWNKELRTLSYN